MDTPRIRVTSGHPTDAELVAVATAIARHRRQATAEAAARRPSGERWIRAARLEASGHPPIDSPMRLTRPR